MVRRAAALPRRIIRRIRRLWRDESVAPSSLEPAANRPSSPLLAITLEELGSPGLLAVRLPMDCGPVAFSGYADGRADVPLAGKLAGISGVAAVFGLSDTLTLRMTAARPHPALRAEISAVLQAHAAGRSGPASSG